MNASSDEMTPANRNRCVFGLTALFLASATLSECKDAFNAGIDNMVEERKAHADGHQPVSQSVIPYNPTPVYSK